MITKASANASKRRAIRVPVYRTPIATAPSMPDESLVHQRGKPGLESHASEQLCVDRDDDRACRHKDRGKRGREENPLCRQDAGR